MKRCILRASLGLAVLLVQLGLGGGAHAKESLYQEDSYRPLTSDRKARQVGDLLTVQIFENASATSSADTNSGRNADVGVQITLPRPQRTHSAGVTTSNDFQGSGSTQRTGRVVAQLTVTVREISPNGDLLVGGIQELEINGEKQLIKLEGRVRQQDVSDQNVVVSTRIADGRISIVGDGTLAANQKPGWWQRLVTWLGW